LRAEFSLVDYPDIDDAVLVDIPGGVAEADARIALELSFEIAERAVAEILVERAVGRGGAGQHAADVEVEVAVVVRIEEVGPPGHAIEAAVGLCREVRETVLVVAVRAVVVQEDVAVRDVGDVKVE